MNQTTLAKQAYIEAIKSWQKRIKWLSIKQLWSHSAWIELTSKRELLEAAEKRLKDLGVGARSPRLGHQPANEDLSIYIPELP